MALAYLLLTLLILVNSLTTQPESSHSHLCSAHQNTDELPDHSSTSPSHSSLSVQLLSIAGEVRTPTAVFEGIWKKAAELVSDPHKIVPAPGCSLLARMVESRTGTRPHLVTPGKGKRFACDADCANYKAFGVCSHVVAVAEVNGMLPEFLEY